MDFDTLKEHASEFISYFETERVYNLVINLDKRDMMILGGVTALVVIVCIIKKWVRIATAIMALCAITMLLHYTIPAEGQSMDLTTLVALFFGGSFIVIAAIYLIFIRAD